MRADSAVEPTRSENITVTWRRSAVSRSDGPAGTAAPTVTMSVSFELSDRTQDFATITEDDAQFLQVLIGQVGKDREINAVFGKTQSVRGHAELFEPVSNLLHWRPPTDLARYPCWTGRTRSLPHAPTYCNAQGKALCRPENYARPRDSAMNVAVRGRITLISVNSPGCVSTSIDPECCLTMIS